MKKLLYISEKEENMPQTAFLLSKNCFLETKLLKGEYVFFWKGTLDTLVSAVSKEGAKKGLSILEYLLQGNVMQWEENKWQCYTCNAVVMYCCAGAYLKIVNKRKINF